MGTTGSGFNNRGAVVGTAPTNNIVRDRSHTVPDQRVIASSSGVAADPAQARSRTTTTATGLGAMPAVRQHLLNHGQSLQTWTTNRDLAFNQLHQQNSAQIEAFQRNRTTQWSQLQGHGSELVRMARDRGADWQNYRRDLWRYRIDRANEIRDQLRNGCDDLFTFDWWGRHRGRNFLLGNHSPWWWWNPCSWNTASAFCGYGWGGPIYYDYGANVLVGDEVYVDGQDSGPSEVYAQQAMALANPQVTEEDPAPPQPGEQATDWQPFGVFALTQEQGGSAVMFFELAVNKDGRISGAFTNILTDDAQMVHGSIDRTTQKVAWHVGDKTDTVYETGVANLTLDVAPVLIHFGTQNTQTWLLVRMSSPDQSTMPAAPAPTP